MASFSAFLSLSGQFEIEINHFAMEVYQSIDELGRPASPTSAGRLTISFNTTADPIITGWMVSPTLQRNGTITFMASPGQTMKTIEFTNAYCVDMEEQFDGTDNWMQMAVQWNLLKQRPTLLPFHTKVQYINMRKQRVKFINNQQWQPHFKTSSNLLQNPTLLQ